jgi:hypothetical protein
VRTRSIAGRVRKLEVRFCGGQAITAVELEVVERLAAGEWQSALKLLEPEEKARWEAAHKGERLLRTTDHDLAELRRRAIAALAPLSQEQRAVIARRLMESDRHFAESRL